MLLNLTPHFHSWRLGLALPSAMRVEGALAHSDRPEAARDRARNPYAVQLEHTIAVLAG